MADGDYADVLARYSAERPHYERLVGVVEEKLRDGLRLSLIRGDVKGRAKEPTSFATKALLKGYPDPLTQIKDKAGVRVSLVYQDDVDSVVEIVRSALTVVRGESKLDALDYDRFGYLGVHCDARLDDDEARVSYPELVGLPVEVQIRTYVQSAWAEVSHEQLYKPPAEVPDDLKRRIHRLVALVELFDAEVAAFMAEASATPGYREAVALAPLAKELLERFDVRVAPDRHLSLELAAAVVPLYGRDPGLLFDEVMSGWIDANEEQLRVQFEESIALPTNPLFTQPESFLLFERLINHKPQLEASWPESVPAAWLKELADAWGATRG